MDVIIEFGKILLPAAAVLYGMYLVIKSFTQQELGKMSMDLRNKNREVTLPIRLQAYERLCLFLERITPNNLVLRLNDSKFSAKQFQQVLLKEVREEYNHNLSQQVYVSDHTWILLKKAMEEVIALINQSASGMTEDAKSVDLAKRIFERVVEQNVDPTSVALIEIKNEARKLF